MSKTIGTNGRLCNQIIRNLALSLIAKKHNLYVDYFNYDLINNKLGIILFIGENNFTTTKKVRERDYKKILNSNNIDYNLNLNSGYFQSEEITDILYKHLLSVEQKSNIIKHNPFKNRYNNNNDLFIHIRLGDVSHFNPGIEYYIECIKATEGNQIYIASDSPNHTIIKELQLIYPTINIINYDEIKTIQFGSTCKNIILSHGSFSAIIGYLSYFTKNIYYPNENRRNGWCPMGLFTNKGWTPISIQKLGD